MNTTLKLYMPLKALTYTDENEYGDLYQSDIETELYPSELLSFKDEIKTAVDRERFSNERGLMEYCRDDNLKSKIENFRFDVEEVNGELMGVAELSLNEDLDEYELADIKAEITGQASDGWGEHFEQQEIPCNGKDIYLSFWGADHWSLKVAEELGLPEQAEIPDMGGMEFN